MTLRLLLWTLLLTLPIHGLLSPALLHAQAPVEKNAQLKKLVEDYLEVRSREQDTQDQKEERKDLIKSIILNVAKGLAIVIALLVLRAIIGAMGPGVTAEDVTSTICVFITTPSEEEAEKITRELMDEDLIISGKITPSIRSIYRWQDQIEDKPETLVILNTRLMHIPQIVERVVVLHSYDVPGIIALPTHLTPHLSLSPDDSRPWWKQLLGRA